MDERDREVVDADDVYAEQLARFGGAAEAPEEVTEEADKFPEMEVPSETPEPEAQPEAPAPEPAEG